MALIGTVSDEVVITFNDFKIGRGEKLRAFIYKMIDNEIIVIDQKIPRDNTSWQNVVEALPEDEPRYVLVDFDDLVLNDGRIVTKSIFITWNPDSAQVKQRMLYSGAKETLKSALNGVGIHVNASDITELDKQAIADIAKRYI